MASRYCTSRNGTTVWLGREIETAGACGVCPCDTETTACSDRLVADVAGDRNRCIECGKVDRRTPCDCC